MLLSDTHTYCLEVVMTIFVTFFTFFVEKTGTNSTNSVWAEGGIGHLQNKSHTPPHLCRELAGTSVVVVAVVVGLSYCTIYAVGKL